MAMSKFRTLTFEVKGWPPAKNEALSMLSVGHSHQTRVIELLRSAREAAVREGFRPFERDEPIGLEVVLYAPAEQDPWDATNYLGGIGDTLEDKTRRGALSHLAEWREVFLYRNDRQIREVRYLQEQAAMPHYTVKIWGPL